MNKTKDNSGTLSENERKEKDTHPDKNGKCSIVCKFCQQENKMWLSAWEKVGQFGNFLSLAFKHMEDKAVTKPDPQAPDLTDDDSTVPF